MSKFNIGDLVKIGEVRGSKESVPVMYGFKNHVGRITERHPDQNHRQPVKIEGKSIEYYLDSDERWLPVFAITRKLLDRQMRFAKSDEVKVIEKEIESIRAEIETLAKQKKDIDLRIKNEKARISRREKKTKALS